MTRALAVLALVFLSFSAQSADYSSFGISPDGFSVISASYCGDAPDGSGDSGHLPCHACRPDIAALPPAPCGNETAFGVLSGEAFAAFSDAAMVPAPFTFRNPRAPPALI